MRYALIGCGRIATNHIIAAKNNNLELVAVCDLFPLQMENLLAKHDLHHDKSILRYTDYRRMIEDLSPDLVSIATGSGRHAQIALFCIEHHVNVIIEKPIAMSMADADQIIKEAKQYDVKVSVCHQNRFNLAVQEAWQAMESGRFGKLSHGSIQVRWNRDKNYYDQALWRGKWDSDGGALMNQCIHGIDLLRWMMGGEVEAVYGVIRQQFHPYLEVEDVGLAILKFKNGAIGSVEGTVNVYPENLEETLCIFGEKGTVEIGGTSTNNLVVWSFADHFKEDEGKQGMKEATSNVYGNGHTRLFADVVAAIREDREPYVNAEEGRKALEIVLAIYKSQKTGKAVKLPLTEFASVDMVGNFQHTRMSVCVWGGVIAHERIQLADAVGIKTKVSSISLKCFV